MMTDTLKTQELIRYCLYSYFTKKKYPISKTTLRKVIFETQQLLSENNSLKHSIPYFWYKFGPDSHVLDDLTKSMIADNYISLGFNEKLVIKKHSKIYEHDDLLEAKKIINQINEQQYSNDSNSIMQHIYEKYAPSKFYLSFRNELVPHFKHFSENVGSKFTLNDIVLSLHRTLGDLPVNSLFSDFKYTYVDFIDLTINLLESKLDKLNSNINTTFSLIMDTFVQGLRVLHHDEYYENKVDGWKKQFDENTMKFEKHFLELNKNSIELGINGINCLTSDELFSKIMDLKIHDDLKTVSFLPPIDDEKLNYGRIDQNMIAELEPNTFETFLNKFRNSKKVIIHHLTEKESENYKILHENTI